MVDLSPTDADRDLQGLARAGGARHVAPTVAAEIVTGSHVGDGHLDAATSRGIVWAAAAAGLLGLLIPEEYGGSGPGAMAAALVGEELGAVDAGVAAALNLTMTVPAMVAAVGTPRPEAPRADRGGLGRRSARGRALSESGVAGSLRDAWTGYACDFTGDMLRLAVAAALP